MRVQAQPAEGKPDRQGNLDRQRADLQPGHEQWLAKALVERAVHAEHEGRHQGQGQNRQVALDLGTHLHRHFGPAQQLAGEEKGAHADDHGDRAQVKRLPPGAAHFGEPPGALVLSPDGQQRLQHAHEGNKHAEEYGGAN